MRKKVLLINPGFTDEITIFNFPADLVYSGSWLLHKGCQG